MSTSAAERYSTVAKPWLKVLLRSIFATSADGMGWPVSTWVANLSSTARVESQCSSSCEGNST